MNSGLVHQNDRIQRRLLAVLLSVFVVAGCNYRGRAPGALKNNRNPAAPQDTDPNRSVETFASPLEIAAGTEVIAQCVVRRDQQHLPDVPTDLQVVPDPGTMTESTDGIHFTPTAAGAYLLKCNTKDGSVKDGHGIHVTVTAASPAVVETKLEFPAAQAGMPVGVGCVMFDGYANPVEDASATGLDVDEALDVDPTPARGFKIRGTKSGDYDVACEFGDLLDTTPELFSVLPGIPERTETMVLPATAGPKDAMKVSCAVSDGFGNLLDRVATSFYVLAGDGSSASTTGLDAAAGSFSVTRAGAYYVSCTAPGYFAGDETPAEVQVNPGLPYSWVVDLEDQDCFWENRRLPLDYEIFDYWGNRVEDADVALTSVPAGAVVKVGEQNYVVVGQGDFDLSLDVVSATHVGATITPESMSVRVDSRPPEVRIDSPGRAESLSSGQLSDSNVHVSGIVTDAVSDITSLVVHGTAQNVDGVNLTENVDFNMSSRWGLSIITAEVADECGNRGVSAQSFLRSPSYYIPRSNAHPPARAAEGIIAHLNQEILDDGNRGDVDDLATVAWKVLTAIDLNDVIPNPIAVSPDSNHDGQVDRKTYGCVFWNETNYRTGYRITKTGAFSYNAPRMDRIDAVSGGVHLVASIRNLRLPLKVWGNVDLQCAGEIDAQVDGEVLANSVDIDARVGISLSGGTPSVSICDSCLSIGFNRFRIDVDWGILEDIGLGGLLQSITDAIVDSFKPNIIELLEATVRDEIQPVLQDFLAGFSLDTGFDLPPPLGMRLNIGSGIDGITFCGPRVSGLSKPSACPASNPVPGWGELSLATQLYPSSRGNDIPVKGAIRRRAYPPSFSNTGRAFGLGLSDDLLNQMLWALWYGGGLSLGLDDLADVTGDLDLNGVELDLFAELPPVIMPGRNGYDIDIGVGDLYVDATVDLGELLDVETEGSGVIKVEIYVSMLVGAEVRLNSSTNELSFAMSDDVEIYVQVVDIDDPGYQGVMSDLFAELLGLVLPKLLDKMLTSFPIPEFDLGALSEHLSDTIWSLHNGRIARENNGGINSDFYTLTGSLQ